MKPILLLCLFVLCFTQTQDEYPLTDDEKKIYERCEWHPDLQYYFSQFLASYERPVHHKLSHQEMAKAQRELFLLINQYEKQQTHFKKNYDSDDFTLRAIKRSDFFKHDEDSIAKYRYRFLKLKTGFSNKEELVSSLKKEISAENDLIDLSEYLHKKDRVFGIYYLLENDLDLVKNYLYALQNRVANEEGNKFSVIIGKSFNSNLNPSFLTNENNSGPSFKASWDFLGITNEALFTTNIENSTEYKSNTENTFVVGLGYSFQIRRKHGIFSYIKTFVTYSLGKLVIEQKSTTQSKSLNAEMIKGTFVPYYINDALVKNIKSDDLILNGSLSEISIKAQTPVLFEDNLGLSFDIGLELGLNSLNSEINYESSFLKKDGVIGTRVGGRTVTVSDVKSEPIETDKLLSYEKQYTLPYISLNWSTPFYVDLSVNSYPLKVGKSEKQLEVILNYTF